MIINLLIYAKYQINYHTSSDYTIVGNHYGTPKPSKDPSDNPFRRTNSVGTLLPGQHPSSEGKRRRNRSNIEVSTNNRSSISRSPSDIQPPMLTRKKSLERAQSSSNLGPLPPNWEMAFTEDGVPYFIEWVWVDWLDWIWIWFSV